jgi:hypothetical protein
MHKREQSDNWKWVIWSDELSFTLFLKSGKNTEGSLQSGMPGSNSETRVRFCDGLGSSIMVQYSVGPNITLHCQITAREYMDSLGNQVHAMIQTLFLNKDAVFQDDSAPIQTAGTVLSWFEKYEGEIQHLPWPAQSPDLNLIQPLWSVLETRVKDTSPPSTSVKQLEDILQQWYKILLETVQNLFEPIPKKDYGCIKCERRSNTILITKYVQHL